MAIHLCSASESSGIGMSPRISFSYDLCHSDVVPVEEYCHRSDASLLDSSFNFDFGVSASFEQEPFSADELFFDGKMLPCEIREKTQNAPPPPPKQLIHEPMRPLPPPPPPPPPPPSKPYLTNTTTDDSKKESLKKIMATTTNELEEKAAPSKSFWRFRRSNSFNCWNGHKRSLICSPTLLSRSNSTGSATNSKRQPLLKDSQNHSHKPPSMPPKSSSSSSSSLSSSSSQKPPLKKNCGSYGSGVRISPVLNVPPPYIAKGTANLFGLGLLFCTGKDKNKKK
ncbi:protein ENL-like [Macadamia integrifolia]|uniref:protein ENL-like n=1 Tax=Macadamia integrifolia TaxID=60698 RepID=UPI001C4E661A|nr:protein ENL-like [Macadamia integrifolia]